MEVRLRQFWEHEPIWAIAAVALSLPGVLNGVAGLAAWIYILGVPDFIDAVFAVGAVSAVWGAFFSPLFTLPAVIVAIIGSISSRSDTRHLGIIWLIVLAGILGTALAWTAADNLLSG